MIESIIIISCYVLAVVFFIFWIPCTRKCYNLLNNTEDFLGSSKGEVYIKEVKKYKNKALALGISSLFFAILSSVFVAVWR